MAGTSRTTIPYVDDFYFSALYDQEELFPISDEKYAEEIQLQEALISSVISSRIQNVSSEKIIEHFIQNRNVRKTVIGESSQGFCAICLDTKPAGEIFRNKACTHSFCADYISKYVAAKIQENIYNVKCPDTNCKGIIEPDLCRPIVPKEVFDRWENTLCESVILGMECGKFQKLNKDERGREDMMLMELAKNKQWRRCPHCKFYVEKVDDAETIFVMGVERSGQFLIDATKPGAKVNEFQERTS
ncbi:unnamed protein product [Ilex paraguariensis]|uniref:RING-type domain-containing protein n=1 Tax=Ilex paraguariensis TaxID=185542 RepID=A0ABC8RJA6_9AQUA